MINQILHVQNEAVQNRKKVGCMLDATGLIRLPSANHKQHNRMTAFFPEEPWTSRLHFIFKIHTIDLQPSTSTSRLTTDEISLAGRRLLCIESGSSPLLNKQQQWPPSSAPPPVP